MRVRVVLAVFGLAMQSVEVSHSPTVPTMPSNSAVTTNPCGGTCCQVMEEFVEVPHSAWLYIMGTSVLVWACVVSTSVIRFIGLSV